MWYCVVIFASFAGARISERQKIYLPPEQGVLDLPPSGAPIAQEPFPTAPPTITTRQGASYICVVAGTCNCVGCNTGNIDIRIVTPDTNPKQRKISKQRKSRQKFRRSSRLFRSDICPPGQVPCYGYQCGTRTVPLRQGDGFTNNGSFPWQAYIQNSTGFAGSGVLIDVYHVLTAAHKVYYTRTVPQNLVVFMGVWNPSDKTYTQNSPVARIVIHENYNPQTLVNDIAILRLARPVVIGAPQINTICMPAQGQAVAPATQCMVSGWGQTAFNVNDAPTNPQKQVTVPIISLADCRTRLATVINNIDLYLNNLDVCAGTSSMRDACLQDGGSPLVCFNPATGTYFVYGLVIWGKGCGTAGIPGVYIGVPNYINWITAQVNALNTAAG